MSVIQGTYFVSLQKVSSDKAIGSAWQLLSTLPKSSHNTSVTLTSMTAMYITWAS